MEKKRTQISIDEFMKFFIAGYSKINDYMTYYEFDELINYYYDATYETNYLGLLCNIHGENIDNEFMKYSLGRYNIETLISIFIRPKSFYGEPAGFSNDEYSHFFISLYDIVDIKTFKKLFLKDFNFILSKTNYTEEELYNLIELLNINNFKYHYLYSDNDKLKTSEIYKLMILDNINDNKIETTKNLDLFFSLLSNDEVNEDEYEDEYEDEEDIIMDESIYILYDNGVYYDGIGHTIAGLGALFFILFNSSELSLYLLGGNIIYFFEKLIYIFTGENINIYKKFYAEVDNSNKIILAKIMINELVKKYKLYDSIFDGKITYFLMKKNILPDEYKDIGRSNIEKIKGQNLIDIIINNSSYEKDLISLQGLKPEEYIPNSIIDIDYITYIKKIEKLYPDGYFNKYEFSEILSKYLLKEDLINDYYDHLYSDIVDNFLKINDYYEFDDSIVIESTYLSELMSMGIKPQASCQSILYYTGYNHQLIGAALNPLVKLFIEIEKPKGLQDIDIENRLFILDNGNIIEMYKYIKARIIGAIKENGFELQRFYGQPTNNFYELMKDEIMNKYYDIGQTFKNYHNIFDRNLGDVNYYMENER